MLRNVIILAQSGLVLFAKDFMHSVAQPRLLGSLLAAMTEFSALATGMKPTFIELSSLAVTLVHDDMVKVFCALVHDRNDSASFGRLIASEILTAFVDEYSADRLRSPATLGHNLRDFGKFDAKIAAIVQHSVRPVLQKLQAQPGVIQALLVTEESILQAGVGEIDQLAILANIEAIFCYSEIILSVAHPNDAAKHIFFDDELGLRRTLLWRIENCVLIVYLSTQVQQSVYADAFDLAEQSKSLISQVLAFMRSRNEASFRRTRRSSL